MYKHLYKLYMQFTDINSFHNEIQTLKKLIF